MDFKAAIRNAGYLLHLEGDTKEAILKEMVDLLIRSGKLSPEQGVEALRAVIEREEKMSTGVQAGVAIPHGKIAAMSGLVAAIALKKEGVDFGALDGQPSKIFVMTISTTLRTGPHLQFLSEVCKLLEDHELRERLLAASDELQMIQILSH